MKYHLMLNIKGNELRSIVNHTKKFEYRDIKPFYDVCLAKCEVPFLLSLINGMRSNAPEVVIEVTEVKKDKKKSVNHPNGVYRLRLGEIKTKKNMNNLVK